MVEPPETCDTAIPAGDAGACVTTCDDGDTCTEDLLVGSDCSVSCSNTTVTACRDDDLCCPAACDATTDNDCPAVCGNGVVEPTETCDTAIADGDPGACVTTCVGGTPARSARA